MPTEHHMESTKVYYTYGPHPPALTVRSGDRVTTSTVDARNWNKDREQIPGNMRQSDPNTQLRGQSAEWTDLHRRSGAL